MSTEPNIRNRVAGAVVLVSLAVIFLPLILDGKKKNQILESYIPDKPESGEIILVNIDEQDKADQEIEDKQDSEPSSQSSEKKTITIDAGDITAERMSDEASGIDTELSQDTEQPVVAEKSKQEIQEPVAIPERKNRPNYASGGHLVQVGGFGSRENASRLVDKLIASQYRAYYKSGTSGNGRIYRVFVGPYLNRADAEKALNGLQKVAGVKPLIVTYDPLKHGQG